MGVLQFNTTLPFFLPYRPFPPRVALVSGCEEGILCISSKDSLMASRYEHTNCFPYLMLSGQVSCHLNSYFITYGGVVERLDCELSGLSF